jgi:hypothetical protein
MTDDDRAGPDGPPAAHRAPPGSRGRRSSDVQAALAAHPGGVGDRVVQLSSGEYEAHDTGVNWPHHVFLEPELTVVDAE